MSLPPRVAAQGCDVCKKPATRWFGHTSAIVCDSKKCYDEHQRRYDQHLGDLHDMDQY